MKSSFNSKKLNCTNNIDEDIIKALELSRKDAQQPFKIRDQEEAKNLERALKESLKSAFGLKSVNKKINNTEYTLHSIVHHKGAMANAGHYVADINTNGEWKRYDDQFVQKLGSKSAVGERSERQSYILFYKNKIIAT